MDIDPMLFIGYDIENREDLQSYFLDLLFEEGGFGEYRDYIGYYTRPNEDIVFFIGFLPKFGYQIQDEKGKNRNFVPYDVKEFAAQITDKSKIAELKRVYEHFVGEPPKAEPLPYLVADVFF